IGLSIRTIFLQYFPDPASFKKPSGRAAAAGAKSKANPYQSIIDWFGKGNDLTLLNDSNAENYRAQLYAVDGLYAAVKSLYPQATEELTALLMEFLLHGFSEFSLISKKGIQSGGYQFGDIVGGMMSINFEEEDEVD